MNPIEIFRVGKHTAMSGVSLDFSQDMLAKAVAAYQPATHEAPVVVGHPKDNHPAFGWIDHLELTSDGIVLAHPKQVDPEFAELVEQGKYKKVSASWYLPDSPANPKQGTLYLRHVGFLGAMPPAIKGLKGVQFNEAEDGIVEYASSSAPYIWDGMASMFRGLREWFIGKEGVDTANQLVPNYMIDELTAEAERKRQAPIEPTIPSFQEQTDVSKTPETTPSTTPTADFSEREVQLAKREAGLAKREMAVQIDDLISKGKVLPAQKSGLVDFMASLDDQDTLDFSEGDVVVKKTPRQFMQSFLESMPNLVEFGEKSASTGEPVEDMTAQEMATKAQEYHAKQAAAGRHISFSEAVAAVQEGKE